VNNSQNLSIWTTLLDLLDTGKVMSAEGHQRQYVTRANVTRIVTEYVTRANVTRIVTEYVTRASVTRIVTEYVTRASVTRIVTENAAIRLSRVVRK
jgi:hypothetical protein